MRFDVGCDLDEFRKYHRDSRVHEYLKSAGVIDGYDENLDYMLNVVIKDPSQLIVWRDNGKIAGHAVWHESNTEEHRKSDPREREDTRALEKVLGGKKDFVELHEIWLMEEYRGKGYGEKFHDFFEKLMKDKGYSDIIFYANHPAAVAICHRRGYQEGGYLKGLKEYVFHLALKNP